MRFFRKNLAAIVIIAFILSPIFILPCIFIISVANADPSCSNVIILEKPNRKNRFIFCPFDVYSIRLYYAELVGKKENNQEKAEKIKGKIIIKEFDGANILYEDRFEIPLIRGKSYIYSSICNIISHQTPLIRFHKNSDFFFKSWQIVPANDSNNRTYLYSHKKYEIIIDFDQDLPVNSLLYARILGDIEDCYAEQQFEYVKEVKK